MRNYLTKEFIESQSRFLEHFGYFPNIPPEIDFNQITYAKLLDKCVEDDFDYTIKKYGTTPPKRTGKPDIFID